MLLTACSTIVGDTPTETASGATSNPTTTAGTEAKDDRRCVRVTGGTAPVNTGAAATDALFLSGEIFVCSDDVVVVPDDDLNEIAAGAQLAAALGGPLLYPHPQLASEVGRLKPSRVHIVGEVALTTPSDADVLRHTVADAVEYARQALGVTNEVSLPATPDTTTVVETVAALAARDRVVVPAASSPDNPGPEPSIDPGAVVAGLASIKGTGSVWMVDASDPVTILMAAATGRTLDVSMVAVDGEEILAHPEVSGAITGRGEEMIRFVGDLPSVGDWELSVLRNGQEVPGGGFFILPTEGKRRYVAFYGHPETVALGALGEQGPEATLQRMQPLLEAYGGDGSQVVPTFEMIASVAAAKPTGDGDYSFEWPISTFDAWVDAARANDAYIILDLQSGRDDFLTQAKMYEELLKLPFVGLALDPEWRLGPDQVHLRQVGRVEATEVNEVVHWLADLVRDNGLPQKMLIVHQFRTFMIQNRELLEQRPELQLIIQMDGDGTEEQKDNTYAALNQGAADAFWSWGWKNFFDEDEPGPPTPESTMGKDPVPVYVSYQ